MHSRDTQSYAADGGPMYVTAKVIAEIYSTDVSTVYKWARSKKFPSEEIGGIRRFHIPTVREKLEGIKRIHEDDLHLFY